MRTLMRFGRHPLPTDHQEHCVLIPVKSYPVLAIHVALRGFYSAYQSNSSLCDEYFQTMTNLRDIITHCIGFVVNHPFMIYNFLKASNQADPDGHTYDKKSAAKNATKEAHMATAFLSGLNQGRYGVLLNDLHNAFWMGCDKYPKTFTAAYYLSINWK